MEHQKKSIFTTKRKQLETSLEYVTQEMYRKNKELAETNQMLSLLRTIDELVLSSHDELEVLCQQITQAISEHSPYPLVTIWSNVSHRKFLSLLGLAMSFKDVPLSPGYSIDPADYAEWLASPDRMTLVNVHKLKNQTIATHLSERPEKIAALRKAMPIQSLAVIKLQSRQRLVGLMCIGFLQETEAVTDREKQLLSRLGDAVGIALDNKLLLEENERVLRKLQNTNKKLQSLDETKDEFISMASHQLRTPLTSVKGYLSMVLEGDAGELNDMQRKLLGQAFISSQRMVYLIADLLNVSRLKTGKFVIETQPTNLADVVESEVSQLVDTAKGRNLTLIYKKPAKFPIYLLDETKVRQVIMNFTDNAIYYTPSGGKITLNLMNKKDSIEFTVSDNGIGVPRAEQRHLFSKFYRAGNARKARPDGTGLGLFMAQKVIVAQGGSVLFHSQEGKGSTFGFTFAKSKLQAAGSKAKPKDPTA